VEIQASYVEDLARLARDLGTNMVRVFTGYERPGIPFDKQYATVVQGLKLAGEKAAPYGVTLAVQNHHDIGAHHDTLAWLIEEVDLPNVKAAFDAWTPTLQGLTPAQIKAAVHRMKPHMVHTTVADYVEQSRWRYDSAVTNFLPRDKVMRAVPLGKGVIDYETFFEALKEIGFQGYIAYEMCEVLEGGGRLENLENCAAQSLDYMKQLGKAVGGQ